MTQYNSYWKKMCDKNLVGLLSTCTKIYNMFYMITIMDTWNPQCSEFKMIYNYTGKLLFHIFLSTDSRTWASCGKWLIDANLKCVTLED